MGCDPPPDAVGSLDIQLQEGVVKELSRRNAGEPRRNAAMRRLESFRAQRALRE